MVNVLKAHLRIVIATLLEGGAPQREIARRTGVDRKTIRRYAGSSNSPGVATGSGVTAGQIPPPRPPAEAGSESGAQGHPAQAPGSRSTPSACEPYRAWIESQVQLGRNAVSIYQDLVEGHGFSHRYNSVKRFVAHLRAREPERYDVLEYLPGEEAQVDYGQGALTLYKPGRYKHPSLFVMTLKYSGKSFRKTVWKADQQVWAQLHEQAFRDFGGCPEYVVPDYESRHVIRLLCPDSLRGRDRRLAMRAPCAAWKRQHNAGLLADNQSAARNAARRLSCWSVSSFDPPLLTGSAHRGSLGRSSRT